VPQATVRVLLIEDNPGDFELVRETLTEADDVVFQVEWAEALLPGLDRLARGGIDLVLLDMSLPDSRGLDGLAAVRNHAPSVPVVLLTGLDSDATALHAVQTGAQDYLVKGTLHGPALARSLQHAIVRQKSQAETFHAELRGARATVLGFAGAKGGVGTTTLACHFATELKRITGEPVLLVDLDLAGNAIGFLMGIDTLYTVVDAAADILRLDEDRWEKLIGKTAGGVDVLQSGRTAFPEDKQTKPERIRFALRFASSLYRWIVCDLGRWSVLSAQVVHEISQVYLVSTYDVLALNEAKAIARESLEGGCSMDSLSLVLNQAPARSGFSSRDVEKLLGIPLEFAIPDYRDQFVECVLDGKRLGESRAFRKRVAQWVAAVATPARDSAPARAHAPFLRRMLGNAAAGD
jgi:Flp pilus assembly CpaE family ATPase